MWIRRGLYVKFIASRLSERARETVNLVSPLLFLDSVGSGCCSKRREGSHSTH